MSGVHSPSPRRRVARADIRLAAWLVLGCTLAETIYLAATWERPDRLPIVVIAAAALLAQLPLMRLRWRPDAVMPAANIGYVAAIAAIAAIDGGVTSPLSTELFIPVVFAALAYDVRPAVAVAVSAVTACVLLTLFGRNDPDVGALVVTAAVACVGAVAILQARAIHRTRVELDSNHAALVVSELRFRSSFEHSLVGMALLDGEERYVEVNDALCRMLGRDVEWLRTHSFVDITHPDDLARDAGATRGLREGAFDHTQFEKRYLHAEGHIVHALVSKSVVRDDDGKVRHFHLQAVDVTEQREEAQRSRRRARQQAAVAAIGQRALDGAALPELFDECVVAVQDTLRVPEAAVGELDGDGMLVVRASRGCHAPEPLPMDPRISQCGLSVSIGAPVLMDDSETETRFEPLFARRSGKRSALTVPIPGPDGSSFGVLLTHSDEPYFFETDDVSFMQALANVLAGALGRQDAERQLRHQSLHDALTGLPNRVLVLDRLTHALARARRTDEVLGVMFLDVDHFKTINDAYGHDAGDELLRALTPRLDEELRAGDTLARFGGDEFVVVCEGLDDTDQVMALAERLLAVFAKPFVLGGTTGHRSEHHLSASIGVAIAGPEHSGDPAALIRDADIAMYRAKQARGRVELFDQRTRTRLVERVRTASDLRRAIDEGELSVVYQPQVNLLDGSVPGLEALLRWEHPERGLVLPDEFISVAEESGLIVPMGDWILDTVLGQLARWDASGDELLTGITCGVNLSARQLVERWLPDQVQAALARHGIEPSRLVCEITETALIDDAQRASDNVEALTASGVSVALDDFCTGYSALEHLKRFSLAEIKLDRTFVADLATSTVDMAVVRGLVEMAGAMDLTTVAEGIETPDQLARLRELGCDQAQGYLFSPGLGAVELQDFLHALPGGRFDLSRMHARSTVA